MAWVLLFQRIKADTDLYLAILRSSGSSWFQARLCKRIEGLLLSGGDGPVRGRVADDGVPKAIGAAFSARLFVGVATWWLEHGKKHSALEVATWLRRVFVRGFLGA